MYTLLIVEDEKIERDSLCTMIESFSLPLTTIVTAQNGEEGLLKYHEYKPDIIMADINMPLLGGLDMIEKIREEDAQVMCLVLTSYDYFSYAQRAIRIGVEDFILKPAHQDTLRKYLTLALEKRRKDENTYTQTSSLVQKMKEMKSLLESECFYAILKRQNELKIWDAFNMANIRASSAFCLLFKEEKGLYEDLHALKEGVEDMGYIVIRGGVINQQYAFFILANRTLMPSDQTLIMDILHTTISPEVALALGGIQNEVSQFYRSYEDAKHKLNSEGNTSLGACAPQGEGEQHAALAHGYSVAILDALDDDPKAIIHTMCHDFLQYDYKDVNEILQLVAQSIIQESNRRYSFVLNEKDVKFSTLTYDNYQNLESVVSETLQKILKPIRSMKYQNSSAIIKKSMLFIERNYARPISLSTLAHELEVSPYYISKLFSKELQRNFTDVVNDVRIKEAKRLVQSDYSFKEVAHLVGFGSQSYFTKMFKKVVGLSPKEYRKLFT